MKLATLLSLAPTALWLVGCGDPLMTRQDRGDAVFDLHGEVMSGADDPAARNLRVAVLFMRDVIDRTLTTPPFEDTLEIEVIPGSLSGRLPAQFRVELSEVPAVYPFDINIIYGNLGGGQTDGVFDSRHAPARVRIGLIAIGPADELAALPTRIKFNRETRTLEHALAPYLPNTTLTSYQVIYAEGVRPDDVIYPLHDEDRNPYGGIPISEGFTLIDARAYYHAIIWQECAMRHLSPDDYSTYVACVNRNADLIGCLDDCPSMGEAGCQTSCYHAFPDQFDRTGCLIELPYSDVVPACNLFQVPRPDQVRVLSAQDPLSVFLRVDDVKAGLWILHANYAE